MADHDYDEEEDDYEGGSATREVLAGDDLVREVRWFSSNGHAYRWSESGDRWIYLGWAHSLEYAELLAERDMAHSHRRL